MLQRRTILRFGSRGSVSDIWGEPGVRVGVNVRVSVRIAVVGSLGWLQRYC